MNPEFAKYFLMMQFATPFNQQSVSDIPLTGFNLPLAQESPVLTNSLIQKLIFNKIINKFENDIQLYPHLVEGNFNLAKQYFNKTLEYLSPLNSDNIIFSLTTSESLYFRIYRGSKEIVLEVFYSKYDDEDKIEAVVIIYDNEKPVQKDFGSLAEIFNNVIYLKDSSSKCFIPDCEYV